jgi:hypothetical protein
LAALEGHQWMNCCLNCQRMWLGPFCIPSTGRACHQAPAARSLWSKGVCCLWSREGLFILWSSGSRHCVAGQVGTSLSYVTLKCWVFSYRTTWYPTHKVTVWWSMLFVSWHSKGQIRMHIDSWYTSCGSFTLPWYECCSWVGIRSCVRLHAQWSSVRLRACYVKNNYIENS